jgi:metal-dependent hydrolase (beta-lactamase superfamily II)
MLLLLPGKGVVVLSVCSHAGIVNVMRDVQVGAQHSRVGWQPASGIRLWT